MFANAGRPGRVFTDTRAHRHNIIIQLFIFRRINDVEPRSDNADNVPAGAQRPFRGSSTDPPRES